MRTSIILVALLTVFSHGVAKAEPADSQKVAERTTQIRLDAGVASAIGIVGVALNQQFFSNLLLELGVGFGFSGAQISFMPKLALGNGRHRFISGLGVSLAAGPNVESGVMLWLNIDALGYEYRGESGWSFFTAAGAFWGLAGLHSDVLEMCLNDGYGTCQAMKYWGPQFRIGVGYWF